MRKELMPAKRSTFSPKRKQLLYLSLVFGVLAIQGSGFVFGQGQVEFSNFYKSAGIDARITFKNGASVPQDYYAELYAGLPGTPAKDLVKVPGTLTIFRPAPYDGYIVPVSARVPGIGVAQLATLQMRVFNEGSWETALCRGESTLISIMLEGGSRPPAPMVGLEPFQVDCIPEPSTLAILGLGAGVLGFCMLRRRS